MTTLGVSCKGKNPVLCVHKKSPSLPRAVRLRARAVAVTPTLLKPDNSFPPEPQSLPLPLPPIPPKTHDLYVIPYVVKLGLQETKLYWRIALAACFIVCSKLAGVMCPMFLKQAVDSLSVAGAVVGTVAIYATTTALVCYGICEVIKNVCKEYQFPIFLPISQAVTRRVAVNIFSHVLYQDMGYHLERKTGRISRILERGMRSIPLLFRAIMFVFLPTAIELLFVCGLLCNNFNPIVAILVGATFTAYVAWTIKMTQHAADARKEVNTADNLTTNKAVDALLNFETVSLFHNQSHELRQYDVNLREYQAASIKTDILAAMLNAGQAVILAAGVTGVLVCAVHVTSGGSYQITGGDLVLIHSLLMQVWAPLQFLGWFYRELRSALVDMEDFFEILRTPSKLVDGSQTIPDHPPGWTAPNLSLSATSNGTGHDVARVHALSSIEEASGSNRGLEVQLSGATFSYGPDRQQVLGGVDFTIKAGQSVAIVGRSGSGKSTIVKLLTRLYDTTAGSVKLNGVDVRDLKVSALRQAAVVVPQETMLFNDTIMENIRYGRPGASDEEVFEAARLAHLDDAVQRMPAKYQTAVGERGLKLSGGEKQRVAIARAFLRQPRLLICDEATSALDSNTETQIMTSLNELAQGRTAVFVAHRLSTIRKCDVIVVLEAGRIAEQGSHDELYRQGGLYQQMWDKQAGEEQAEGQAEAWDTADEEDVQVGQRGTAAMADTGRGSAYVAAS